MMKKVFALILLIIFSFQVLPVKAISNIIIKKQLTEETDTDYSKNMNDTSDSKLKNDADYFQLFTSYDQDHSRVIYLSHEITTALHVAEKLPSNFIPEILTPPPNSSC